jgi:hypothetical protein
MFSPERRCEVTKNMCGTDTWMTGRPCQCAPCKSWLSDYTATHGLSDAPCLYTQPPLDVSSFSGVLKGLSK